MMRRFWLTLLGSLALGLAGLWLVLPGAFELETFRAVEIRLPRLGALLALLAAWWLIAGWRIKLLVRCTGASLSLWRGIQTNIIGVFSSTVTPSGGGNALGITWILTRFGVPLQSAAAVSVLFIVLDMAFFAWAVPVSVLYLATQGVEIPVEHLGLIVAVFSAVVLSISLLLTFRLRYATRLLKKVFALRHLRRFRLRTHRFLDELELASQRFAVLPWHLHLGIHALSAVTRLLFFALLSFSLLTVGIDIAQLSVISIQTIVHAFAFLVPTPGASGYQEGAISWALKGSASADSLSLGVLLWRFTSFYLYFLAGPLIGGAALMNNGKRAAAEERGAVGESPENSR